MKLFGIIGLIFIVLYFIYKAFNKNKVVIEKEGSIIKVEAEPYKAPEFKNVDYKVSLTVSDDIKIKESDLYDFIETIEDAINRGKNGFKNLTNSNSLLTESLNVNYLTINQIKEYEKKWFK